MLTAQVRKEGGREGGRGSKSIMTVCPILLLSANAQIPTALIPPFLPFSYAKVLPPPAKVAMEVGERRLVARRPVHVYFGDELTPDRVGSEFVARKIKEDAAEGRTEEELLKRAGKEGFTYVAEGDVKRHYDVLMGLDMVLEEEEVTVQYK